MFRYSYPVWLLIFVLLPLALIWFFQYRNLKRNIVPILLAPLGAIIFSFPWDYIAIRERIWYFTEPNIIGTWIFGLPIEEWIFIIFVASLFASITVLLWNKCGTRE